MNTNPVETFQNDVGALIVRNRNLLDILSKCQITCGKIFRNTTKASTACGCIKISGEKLPIDFSTESDYKQSGIDGSLCRDCRSSIESEIGECLFYLASLCNALGISMSSVMNREIKKVEVLGKYSLH